MFRYLYVIVFLLCFNFAYSQNIADNKTSSINDNPPVNSLSAPTDEIENPDESGSRMPNIGIAEEKPIIEVVEGVGRVQINNAPFRSGPSLNSPIVRNATLAEKVILIGERGDWYKVVMYNNMEAYIRKRDVISYKIFPDESITTNSMNKKISFEIINLINKFNHHLQNSNYVKKYQTRPMVTLEDARIFNNTMSLTFYYYCANKEGKPIPSYKDNDLDSYVKDLFSLIAGRLILSNTKNYELIIKVPVFDNSGNVLNYDKIYSVIKFSLSKVDMEKIRKGNISILSLAESTVSYNKLFAKFPM